MSHGHHIYARASDMTNIKMCAHPQSDLALPHWKCVLRCWAKCPCGNLPYQEKDDKYSDRSTSIRFHIYHLILRCKTYGRIRLNDFFCRMCKQDSDSEVPTHINTRKQLAIMQTTMYYFQSIFYIPEIQKLDFPIPHVKVLGTNHCVDSRLNTFKCQKQFKYVLCRRDYSERVVDILPH